MSQAGFIFPTRDGETGFGKSGAGGIAEALGLAREFVGQEKLIVVLGDNVLEKGIKAGVEAFAAQDQGARVFLKSVENPREYGVAEIANNKIARIIEKPQDPPSNLAIIGIYMYPPDVFEVIEALEPSARGELEITDVNNAYIDRGAMEFDEIDGWWLDVGENHEALLRANLTIARHEGVNI